MNIQDFTFGFLPRLVELYASHAVGLKALVDFHLWAQLFPTPPHESRGDEVQWSSLSWHAFPLQDSSLLLTIELPEPQQHLEPKFIGIRLYNKSHEVKYYILRRAKFYDEPWEIWAIDYTSGNQSGKHIPAFLIMNDGTWSLRNFVLTIQQTPLVTQHTSLLNRVKNRLGGADKLMLSD